MDKPAQFQKHALDSLRLESECMQMARRTPNPDVRVQFIRMARHWNRLATTVLDETAATYPCAGKAAAI